MIFKKILLLLILSQITNIIAHSDKKGHKHSHKVIIIIKYNQFTHLLNIYIIIILGSQTP